MLHESFCTNMRFLLCYVIICCIIRLRWGLNALLLNKIPTIVGREDPPKVGSLLLIGLGTISDERSLTTRICMINAIIGVRDLVLALSAWQV